METYAHHEVCFSVKLYWGMLHSFYLEAINLSPQLIADKCLDFVESGDFIFQNRQLLDAYLNKAQMRVIAESPSARVKKYQNTILGTYTHRSSMLMVSSNLQCMTFSTFVELLVSKS